MNGNQTRFKIFTVSRDGVVWEAYVRGM